MIIRVSGINVKVNKKDIKNMHLYVKPPNGDVMVSAPLSMSDESIERFARSKISWIEKQVSKFENQPRQSKREYVSGETLYVWGKQYYIRTKNDKKKYLVLLGNKADLSVPKDSTVEQREKFIREWYRELLKSEVKQVLPKWEEVTGIKATTWQTKQMTTRWGTCNPKTGKIWINLQLAKKPPICLEYIILHELIHLVEKNHNKRFVSLMDQHMPMWREIKTTLNNTTLEFME